MNETTTNAAEFVTFQLYKLMANYFAEADDSDNSDCDDDYRSGYHDALLDVMTALKVEPGRCGECVRCEKQEDGYRCTARPRDTKFSPDDKGCDNFWAKNI